MKHTGTVHLVGAGPGDAGLLTLRGAELLGRADVVVYDALVNPDLLRLAPKTAELIYGGKRSRDHAIPQEDLNQLLVAKAKEGKTVVRDLLASDDTGMFRLRTPRLDVVASGAGDAIAALFFAHYLRQGKIGGALSSAGSAIFGVLQKTLDAGANEIQVVTAQDEIANPSRVFEAERLSDPAAPERVL